MRLFWHCTRRACSRDDWIAGSKREIRTPMIARTMKTSMSVKAGRLAGNTIGFRMLNIRSIGFVTARRPVGAMAQSSIDCDLHRRPLEPHRAVPEGEVGAVAA